MSKTNTTTEDRAGYLKTAITRGYVKDSISPEDGPEKHQVRFKGRLPTHVMDQIKRFFEIKEVANVHESDETHLLLEYNP